jgi:hypothetical protein
MQIESNEETGKFHRCSGSQGQVHPPPPLPHEKLGCSGEGFESSDHLYLCSFVTLEKPVEHCY